ncbi:SusE domain-containing protein [Winogradskyella alexanderae]|uniref:SusE domain-containing protein n=1 Tax=Winogradskyella alexanderae TaxID=2877123 RepID=A0ABS7XT27_9FLAO|nr:SusE domain-containing protein [Winogradskyella alexanderae]MCA0132578.1 SusE domain-containing protein [Winogradskyella alexanderae]
MKKLSILGLFIFALISFNSCETEDDVVFTTDNSGDLSFTNNFSAEYLLTPQTAANLAERFTWDDAEVDVPTNVTYQLEKSNTGDFTDAETIGATTGNEISITIGDLLSYAAQLGLDADPNTPAPNTGEVFFRLKSFIGDGSLENFGPAQGLTLVMLEVTDTQAAVCDFDQKFMVGAGVKFTGWDWATPQKALCSGTNVYTINVDLISVNDPVVVNDGNFRFFTTETDWGSGINYPGYIAEGYTIDPMFEDAQDGDNNFLFTGPSGKYFLTVDALNKTITLDDPTPQGNCDFDQMWAVGAGLTDAGWSWDTPVQLMCEGDGVYSGWVNYTSDGDANFRFFTTATDWGSGLNYPHFEGEGYTIDANFENAQDGDFNFKFIGTSGQYYTTIDTLNKTITLE